MGIRQKSLLTGSCGTIADLDSLRGKADDVEAETGTPRAAGIGAQAPKEGFTEITSGRSRRQQGTSSNLRRLLLIGASENVAMSEL